MYIQFSAIENIPTKYKYVKTGTLPSVPTKGFNTASLIIYSRKAKTQGTHIHSPTHT